MLAKIIDMDFTDAFVSLLDGSIIDIGVPHIPPGAKIGDTINVEPKSTRMINHKVVDFF
jgi:hypothetical protein